MIMSISNANQSESAQLPSGADDIQPYVDALKDSLAKSQAKVDAVNSWDEAIKSDRNIRRAASELGCGVNVRKLDSAGNRVTDPETETVAKVGFRASEHKSRRGRPVKPVTAESQAVQAKK